MRVGVRLHLDGDDAGGTYELENHFEVLALPAAGDPIEIYGLHETVGGPIPATVLYCDHLVVPVAEDAVKPEATINVRIGHHLVEGADDALRRDGWLPGALDARVRAELHREQGKAGLASDELASRRRTTDTEGRRLKECLDEWDYDRKRATEKRDRLFEARETLRNIRDRRPIPTRKDEGAEAWNRRRERDPGREGPTL